jgi:hypothetical protein
MVTRNLPICNTWEIALWDQGLTPDGGRATDVSLYHHATATRLKARVIDYQDDSRVVDSITLDAINVHSTAARCLVSRIYDAYSGFLFEYGNTGVRTFLTPTDFPYRTNEDISDSKQSASLLSNHSQHWRCNE